MSGSSAYPTSIDNDQANVDAVDLVLAADVNDAQKSANQAQIYLGQDPVNINDALAGSPLTVPNVVGGYTGATSGGNAARLNPQVGALSTIATMLKRITGAANWRTSPLASLADLLGFKLVTAQTVATLTGSVNISSIIATGALGSRPAAAAANTGWLYIVTSGGTGATPNLTITRSTGSAWENVGVMVYAAGSFAAGDIAYYDAVAQRWARLAIGTSGQTLKVASGLPSWATVAAADVGAVALPAGAVAGDTIYFDGTNWQRLSIGSGGKVLTASGGVPIWTPMPNPTEITLPAVYSSISGTWALYSTIQAAIDAASGVAADYQMVVIPPGKWVEDILCKANVPVVELVPRSVEIQGSVFLVDACSLSVWRVTTADPAGITATAILINCASPTGLAFFDVGELMLYGVNTGVRVGINCIQGIAHGRVGRFYYAGNAATNASFIIGTGGTLNVVGLQPFVTTGAAWATMSQIYAAGGTINLHGGMLKDDPLATALNRVAGNINVYGVAYNRKQTSGKINQMGGDRASRNYASAAFFNSVV